MSACACLWCVCACGVRACECVRMCVPVCGMCGVRACVVCVRACGVRVCVCMYGEYA